MPQETSLTHDDPLCSRIIKLISDTQEIPIERVVLDAEFDEIGLTSLNALSIVFEIENEFGVAIPDDDALMITNLRQLVDQLRDLLAKQNPGALAALQA